MYVFVMLANLAQKKIATSAFFRFVSVFTALKGHSFRYLFQQLDTEIYLKPVCAAK